MIFRRIRNTKKIMLCNKFIFVILVNIAIYAFPQNRWNINDDYSITWNINNNDNAHNDHIEMSGLSISVIAQYGVSDNGHFNISRKLVWPMLRIIPNNTYGNLIRNIDYNVLNNIYIDGRKISSEKVQSISLDGTIKVVSKIPNSGLSLSRVCFPSTTKPAYYEKYVFKNISNKNVEINSDSFKSILKTDKHKCVYGTYNIITIFTPINYIKLFPGDSITLYGTFLACKENEIIEDIDIEKELKTRMKLVSDLKNNLVFECPNKIVNTMFAFSKVRASEIIYKTKNGLMHGPGGGTYYAAIWANDQAEYVNPFFPYLGYEIGNQSAFNSYSIFAKYMNSNYSPIPSSIIAEGTDIWNGAGDRGDAAMIAYGASRYVMARGSINEANKLWPLIEWCLEYCNKNINEDGVVASDTDELEGRFKSGKANLCTSSLYFDALNSASLLCKELKKPIKQSKKYAKQAKELKNNIDKYFGGNVEGYETYHYYKGNSTLRSWICIPLTVGIYNRKDATVSALFSSRLWADNGLLTESGSRTYWDRSTLYALRGVFACGETDKALKYLDLYSKERLLGEHVPYAIEAWPEGDKRHLSAESGLYCRIIIEGMFGIRPIGLRSFILTPRLPSGWEKMSLKKVKAFGNNFDIEVVSEKNNKIRIMVITDKHVIKEALVTKGQSVKVFFK